MTRDQLPAWVGPVTTWLKSLPIPTTARLHIAPVEQTDPGGAWAWVCAHPLPGDDWLTNAGVSATRDAASEDLRRAARGLCDIAHGGRAARGQW